VTTEGAAPGRAALLEALLGALPEAAWLVRLGDHLRRCSAAASSR
jgi:hypothetical protein